MNHKNNNTLEKVRVMLGEMLDLDGKEITAETYLIRDLGAESIDLLELAVAINQGFSIKVQDDQVFLWRLRFYMLDAAKNNADVQSYLAGKYPFLDSARITEILADHDSGPVLKVKDIISYINYQGSAAAN